MGRGHGWTLIELLAVLTVAGLAIVAAAPTGARMRSEARMAAAVREISVTLQALRWRSVSSRRGQGLWFRESAGTWSWVEVEDGNGNGLRIAELRAGIDRIRSGPRRVDSREGGVRLGLPEDLPVPRVPPGQGWLDPRAGPVRFGPSRLVAFGPTGSASSGSLYLVDGDRGLSAIVLFGPTARVRVVRFDRDRGEWR